MKEEWRDISPYKEYYQVSNKGRVKSKERRSEGDCMLKERIMKNYINSNQVFICLYPRSKKKTSKVARLVYEAFHGMLVGDEIVKFKDNNPLNIKLENLYKISRGVYNSSTIGIHRGKNKDKGISFKSGKYEVTHCLNKSHKYLGRYETIEEAREAYKKYDENQRLLK